MDSSVRDAVRLFKRLGAKCRKTSRKYDVYSCWKGGVEARIDPREIRVVSKGDFRVEFLRLTTDDGWSDVELEKVLSELIGSKFEINVDGSIEIRAEFPIERMRDAVKLFNYLAENDVWVAGTNMDGELRVYKKGETIEGQELVEDIEKIFGG